MLQPTWLVDTLAGIMVAVSAYCVARLVVARFWGRALHRDVNVAHVAMGVGMAGMLVASLHTLPTGAWEVVFGALVLWFAGRAARIVSRPVAGETGGARARQLSHNLTHLVMAGAMLFMFAEPASTAGAATGATMAMGSGGTSNLGALALLFIFVLFVSAVWHADELSRYTTVRRTVVAVGQAPVALSMPSRPVTMDGPVTNDGDAHEAPGADTGTPQALWLAPRLEMGCHIAMCVTMGYMLILLL